MIKIKQIKKNYKNFKFDVKDIEIKQGESIAIIGNNGSGKTTLAESLMGLRKMDIFNVEKESKLTFNAVFQESAFEGNFKVKEIIGMYICLYKLKNAKLDLILQEYGIYTIKDTKYRSLSGGEKQKVKIAVALMNKAQVIIVDEISTALDLAWQKIILKKIEKYKLDNPKSSFIMITHNVDEVNRLCDKAIIMSKGKNIKEIKIDKADTEAIVKELEGVFDEE